VLDQPLVGETLLAQLAIRGIAGQDHEVGEGLPAVEEYRRTLEAIGKNLEAMQTA
jgi:hypothetical protein